MIVFLISVRTVGFVSIQDETVLSATALVLDTKAMSALMVSHTHWSLQAHNHLRILKFMIRGKVVSDLQINYHVHMFTPTLTTLPYFRY